MKKTTTVLCICAKDLKIKSNLNFNKMPQQSTQYVAQRLTYSHSYEDILEEPSNSGSVCEPGLDILEELDL